MKTHEDLRTSREGHENLLARFGGKIPTSILKHDKTDKAIDIVCGEFLEKSKTIGLKLLQKTKVRAFDSGSHAKCGSEAMRFPRPRGRGPIEASEAA